MLTPRRFGYAAGFAAGVAACERTLAVLREELGRKERERAAAQQRADDACDRMLALYGARFTPPRSRCSSRTSPSRRRMA